MTVKPTAEVLCNLCNSVFVTYEQQQLTAEQKVVWKRLVNEVLRVLDMKADFDGLAGFTKLKPFECVGTKSEFTFALDRLADKLAGQGRKLPKLLQYYKENADSNLIDNNLLNDYNPMNNAPDDFLEIIMEMYKNVAENY